MEFATVIDKDYFLPYLNDEVGKSRNRSGFPRYRKEFKNGTPINAMFPSAAQRGQLLNLLLWRARGVVFRTNSALWISS